MARTPPRVFFFFRNQCTLYTCIMPITWKLSTQCRKKPIAPNHNQLDLPLPSQSPTMQDKIPGIHVQTLVSSGQGPSSLHREWPPCLAGIAPFDSSSLVRTSQNTVGKDCPREKQNEALDDQEYFSLTSRKTRWYRALPTDNSSKKTRQGYRAWVRRKMKGKGWQMMIRMHSEWRSSYTWKWWGFPSDATAWCARLLQRRRRVDTEFLTDFDRLACVENLTTRNVPVLDLALLAMAPRPACCVPSDVEIRKRERGKVF